MLGAAAADGTTAAGRLPSITGNPLPFSSFFNILLVMFGAAYVVFLTRLRGLPLGQIGIV